MDDISAVESTMDVYKIAQKPRETNISGKIGRLNNTIAFVFLNCRLIFGEYYEDIMCSICTSRKCWIKRSIGRPSTVRYQQMSIEHNNHKKSL